MARKLWLLYLSIRTEGLLGLFFSHSVLLNFGLTASEAAGLKVIIR